MQRSAKRILTSHVGSLIRPPEVLDHLRAKQTGVAFSDKAFAKTLKTTVAKVVKQQAKVGIDIPSDGEFGKGISWSQYALERLSGFERRAVKPGTPDPFARGVDRERFAEFYAELDARDGRATVSDSVCVGPISYTGMGELQRDIRNFKVALARQGMKEGFLPVAAPSSVIPDRKNEYYASGEKCLEAIADAMRVEYKAIVDAGLILQLDDARAAVTYDRMVPPGTLKDFRKWVGMHVEVLNHALRGIPADRVRYHVCWGSWPGPHVTDVPLKDIVDLILKVNAGAYVIEGANPRHEHEWHVWESAKMREEKILLPGVISHVTNVVEHPELVAERITRLARILGRERVIASTDCGFAQGPFHRRVHPSVMWAKFEALSEGARIASKALWSAPRKTKAARGSNALPMQ
ncbi:MAG: epoxyalkane--coenzyme M transferase [Betaproteobacteria bacterium]|nr:epoxyalkane--coenzyme M transferase [Betaproteobacteria bacterium]